MEGLLGETLSVCPECLDRIPARKISENGKIYLEKECGKHGKFKTLIWRGNAEQYVAWGDYGVPPVGPLESLHEYDKGCPYDCGLCSEHRANACSMIMLVTDRCNAACPVCLADCGTSPHDDPDLKTIEGMYETVLRSTGTPTIQLSGGEPTVRDDLPEIVSMG